MSVKSSSPTRRGFLSTSAAGAVIIAAVQACTDRRCERTAWQEQAAGSAQIQPRANASFASLKQIEAGVLNVGYAEAGPADGPAVLFLHGWPYDIHTYVDVAPLLASAGYHVIAPYLRGYGTTRFLSTDTVRNGQPSSIAVDMIALMDAVKIEKATLPAAIGRAHRMGDLLTRMDTSRWLTAWT